MAKIKGRDMQTQGQHNDVLSKRKPSKPNLLNNPLKNVVGIHEQ